MGGASQAEAEGGQTHSNAQNQAFSSVGHFCLEQSFYPNAE